MSKLYYTAITGDGFFTISHYTVTKNQSLPDEAQKALKAIVDGFPEEQAEEIREKLSTGVYKPTVGLAVETGLETEKEITLLERRDKSMEEVKDIDLQLLSHHLEIWLTTPIEEHERDRHPAASWRSDPEYVLNKSKTPLQILKENGLPIPGFIEMDLDNDGDGPYIDWLQFKDANEEEWKYKPEGEIFLSAAVIVPTGFYEAVRRVLDYCDVAEAIDRYDLECSTIPIVLSDDTVTDFLLGY